MMNDERYTELSEQIDKLTDEEQQFVLWYLLPKFKEAFSFKFSVDRGIKEWNAIQGMAYAKYSELCKAAIDMRNVLADLLW